MDDNAARALAAGRSHYYAGSLADAEVELQQAIALDASSADAWFMLAMTCRALARPQEAADACRRAVDLDAEYAAAHNLLGVLSAEAGRNAEAIVAFQRALALRPTNPETWFNLGLALFRERRLTEAVECWRSAVSIQPQHAGAQSMLRQIVPPEAAAASQLGTTQLVASAMPATVLNRRQNTHRLKIQLDLAKAAFDRGDLQAAEAACREALRANPDDPRVLCGLGVVLLRQRRYEEAQAELRRAVALAPGDADNHYALGCTMLEMERGDSAIPSLMEAVRIKPDHVLAHVELGNALAACERYGEANEQLRLAIDLDSQSAEAHYGLGNLLIAERRYGEAEAACRRAVELRPAYAAAWNSLGRAVARQRRYPEAEDCYERALEIDPTCPRTRYNRSFARLIQGRWLEAWSDYEHRFSLNELRARKISGEAWDGSPLEGRTILLYADQALGDTLQCVRYVPLVRALGGRVLLATQSALHPLLRAHPDVEQLLSISDPLPRFDVQAPLMSLPGLFRTTPENVLAGVPYLSAEPALMDRWRKELAALPGMKIGIAWQGNPHFRPGLHRSIPLAEFESLARLCGVQLISLQKGPGSEQLVELPFRDKIFHFSGLDDESGPFMDTAAIITQLDLIICCDSAVAHLAGTLAAPVWLALPAVCEWRWLLDREDTPWYPTMRLFRQPEPGNWSAVFDRIAKTLAEKLGAVP